MLMLGYLMAALYRDRLDCMHIPLDNKSRCHFLMAAATACMHTPQVEVQQLERC